MGLIRGETRKLFQLVGELDRQNPAGFHPRTFSQYGLAGTDVGAVVDYGPGLPMLIVFGDTWTGARTAGSEDVTPIVLDANRDPPPDFSADPYHRSRPFNGDAIAIVARNITSAESGGFGLEFFAHVEAGSPDAHYSTLEVPRVDMLTASVPTGALGLDHSRALLFVTGFEFTSDGRHRSPQQPGSWIALWDTSTPKTEEASRFSTGKFSNFLCPVRADSDGIASTVGLGELADDWIWLWGTGYPPRETPVYLARAPLAAVVANPADRTAWEFFVYIDDGGEPRFAATEDDAQALFSHNVGEYSVYFDRFLGRWLMLDAGSDGGRGVFCRSAPNPWGPWDEEGVVIFDPVTEGYGQFIHARPDDTGRDDGLSDPGRESDSGGIYASIVIPRLVEPSEFGTNVRYMLSTWNPYTVVLMESTLAHADPIQDE